MDDINFTVLENLLKSNNRKIQPVKPNKAQEVIEEQNRLLANFCRSLSYYSYDETSCDYYDPQKSKELLEDFAKLNNNGRIYYSVLYNNISSVINEKVKSELHAAVGDRFNKKDISKISSRSISIVRNQVFDIFENNLQALKLVLMNEHNIEESNLLDTQMKIFQRIYDHFNLLRQEFDLIETQTQVLVNEAKEDINTDINENIKPRIAKELHKEFDGMAKDYVTILGIFASIVFAFSAGTDIFKGVFSVIGNSSHFTVLILLIVGFILLNLINLLVKYVFFLTSSNRVNNIEFPIDSVNLMVLGGIVVDLALWMMQANGEWYIPFSNSFIFWVLIVIGLILLVASFMKKGKN